MSILVGWQFDTLYGKKAAALYTQVLICARQTEKLVQRGLEGGCVCGCPYGIRFKSVDRSLEQTKLRQVESEAVLVLG